MFNICISTGSKPAYLSDFIVTTLIVVKVPSCISRFVITLLPLDNVAALEFDY